MSTPGLTVTPLDASNAEHLAKVKMLGINNTKTLGLFPPAAFDDYARRNRILIAVVNNSLCVGYVLFSTTRERVTIFQLCVDDEWQRKGIARLLVDTLSTQTKHLRGVFVKCRKEYVATALWPRLGFEALGIALGRNKAGLPVLLWWRSHGGVDLFSEAERQRTEAKLPIVIDLNVILDLQGRQQYTDETSLYLQEDWLAGSLEFLVTPEAANEMTIRGDIEQVAEGLRFVQSFSPVRCDGAEFQKVCDELRPHFGPIGNERDEADLRHIAWAIAGGVSYFVTRDEELCARAETIAAYSSLKILRPVELICHFDELRRAEAYQPVSLDATDFTLTRLGTDRVEEVASRFQNGQLRETKASLRSRLNHFLASPNHYEVNLITANDVPLGIYAFGNDASDADTMEVVLLRVVSTKMGTALGRHIGKRLVEESISRGRRFILVRDELITPALHDGLVELGFFDHVNGLAKVNLPIVASISQVAEAVRTFEPLSDEQEGLNEWADLILQQASLWEEEVLWPLKIRDLDVPAYIIPIEPRWASELFDVGLAGGRLFGRDPAISFNIESVYYRSCKGVTLRAPARILWYVSEGHREVGTKAIRACSQLNEVCIDGPKVLFRKFERFGVFQWGDVYAKANKDVKNSIMAIRFSGTELLKKPIPIRELRPELKAIGANHTMVSPVEITPELFFKLYEKSVR